jgi:hypothetical protein
MIFFISLFEMWWFPQIWLFFAINWFPWFPLVSCAGGMLLQTAPGFPGSTPLVADGLTRRQALRRRSAPTPAQAYCIPSAA